MPPTRNRVCLSLGGCQLRLVSEKYSTGIVTLFDGGAQHQRLVLEKGVARNDRG